MKKICFIFCLIITTLPILASNWEQIEDNIYIDKDSIRTCPYQRHYKDNCFCFWLKNTKIDQNGMSINEKNNQPSYSLDYFIINTIQKQIAVKSSNIYDKHGNILHNETYEDYSLEWFDIAPDSTAELYYNIVNKNISNDDSNTYNNFYNSVQSLKQPNIIKKNKNHYTINP